MLSMKKIRQHKRDRITIWGLWKYAKWQLHRMKKKIFFRCG